MVFVNSLLVVPSAKMQYALYTIAAAWAFLGTFLYFRRKKDYRPDSKIPTFLISLSVLAGFYLLYQVNLVIESKENTAYIQKTLADVQVFKDQHYSNDQFRQIAKTLDQMGFDRRDINQENTDVGNPKFYTYPATFPDANHLILNPVVTYWTSGGKGTNRRYISGTVQYQVTLTKMTNGTYRGHLDRTIINGNVDPRPHHHRILFGPDGWAGILFSLFAIDWVIREHRYKKQEQILIATGKIEPPEEPEDDFEKGFGNQPDDALERLKKDIE